MAQINIGAAEGEERPGTDESLAARAERYAAKMGEVVRWLNRLGASTNGTRFQRYLRYLRAVEAGRYEIHEDLFDDPEGHPFQSPIDRWLYVLREVDELVWIMEGMAGREPAGLLEKLKFIVGGADFVPLDRKTLSRDIQFELRVAAYFARGGYDVDLTQDADVTASRGTQTYVVECKRVASRKQLERRVRDARDQLRRRLAADRLLRKNHGIIALEVTKLGFPKQGLTTGLSVDHVRLALREKVVEITDEIAAYPWLFEEARLLEVFLQVHVANLALDGAGTFSMLSPGHIGRPAPTLSQKVASKRFRSLIPGWAGLPSRLGSDTGRKPRTELVFAAGTRLAWDDHLVEHFCATGELPSHDMNHEVLWMDENGRETTFALRDLAMLVMQMPAKEIAFVRRDRTVFMERMMVLLYLQRFPYKD